MGAYDSKRKLNFSSSGSCLAGAESEFLQLNNLAQIKLVNKRHVVG
jgi:hypothetical protein